jgi:hypothetical protein
MAGACFAALRRFRRSAGIAALASDIEGDQGKRQIERALSMLNGLKDQGRLAPADEPKIAALEELLKRPG